MKRAIYILLSILLAFVSDAQTKSYSVQVHFRQGYSTLDLGLRDNRAALDRMIEQIVACQADSDIVLRRVEVVGAASPEGSIMLNERLSRRRAATLFKYLSSQVEISDSLCDFTFSGRDWSGLYTMACADEYVPYRDETISLLYDIAKRTEGGERAEDRNFERLVTFREGRPYRYMYNSMFPNLRVSHLRLWYEPIPRVAVLAAAPASLRLTSAVVSSELLPFPMNVSVTTSNTLIRGNFYMALRTNMLYDVLAVPNIGAEFYLGRGWTVGADWMYGWWNTDRRHRYWRIYGGDVAVRRYFGGAAAEKPLTGHHLGLYAQVLTYDFEWGGCGYMAGTPGGDIFDRAHFGLGVEYGYSLPIARRLNIDFTVGVGYLGGKYHEYTPEDNCYVWQATKNRRYFGPTKVEVSLVWLIGRGNCNKNKVKGGAE